MRNKITLVLTAWLAMAGALRAEEPAEEGAEQVTVITSDRLTYDGKGGFAKFEGNVVVTDPQVQLTANDLTLHLNDAGEAESIEAEGEVRIWQEDKRAVGERATYEVETGKITLTGDPQIKQGKDVLGADTITFWRDHDKLICEPNARLVIYPKEGMRDEFMAGGED